MIFATSDPHFGHKNVIKYCNRPFADIDEMDEILIKNWNTKVSPNDTVYLLGDISYRNMSRTSEIFARLNGDIKLAYGNHDQLIKKNRNLQNRFSEIATDFEIKITDSTNTERLLVMSHFPKLVWHQHHRGSWHIHGHCHGGMNYPLKMRIMDVGVDPCGYFPVSLLDIEKYMNNIDGLQYPDHHQPTAD